MTRKAEAIDEYKQHPIYKTDFSKPISILIDEIRDELFHSRGLITDIEFGTHWGERVEHIKGLLTCGIVCLNDIRQEILNFEIKRDDNKYGKSLFFNSRGIGFDRCPCCFVCGAKKREPDIDNLYLHNISAFVKSKEDGKEISSWFTKPVRLDYRENEPNWIQLKIGSCTKHLNKLKALHTRTYNQKRIRKYDIALLEKETD